MSQSRDKFFWLQWKFLRTVALLVVLVVKKQAGDISSITARLGRC